MHVVIDIDDELYQMCKECHGDADPVERAIANGMPFPKGYGNHVSAKNDVDMADALNAIGSMDAVLNGIKSELEAMKVTAARPGFRLTKDQSDAFKAAIDYALLVIDRRMADRNE